MKVLPKQITESNAMTELEQRIAAAAEKLTVEGMKVTSESVRQEIGGGSLRDICPALRKWKEMQVATESATWAIPEEVTAAFRKAESTAWMIAEKRAHERVYAIELACARRIEMAEIERDEALVEISRMEAQRDTVWKELTAARDAVAQTASELGRAQAERDAALSKIESMSEALAAEKGAAASAISIAAELRGRIAAMSDALAGARETTSARGRAIHELRR